MSDLAKEHGVRGGIIVPHAYRATEETKTLFRDQNEYSRIWRFVRENKTPWEEQVYWSPHYHVVGLCRDFKEGDPEADGGWIANNIKRGERHSLKPFHLTDPEGYDDMASVVRYLLSHATFPKDEDRMVVTWFGSLHPTNFDPESDLSDDAWSVIQRMAEEVVGVTIEDSESGDAENADDCPQEGCPGEIHSHFRLP